MHRLRTLVGAIAILGLSAAHARADATGFLGVDMTPTNHALRGFSVGAGLLVVGVEVEYASAAEDTPAGAPALRTGSGNLLLQTPVMIHGFQPYAEFGGGFYRERLNGHTDTGFAPSSGVGLKIGLAGPLRLRVDYRVFRLGRGALHSPAHRVYLGLNLKL